MPEYVEALEGKPLTLNAEGKKRVVGTITSVEIADEGGDIFVRAEVTDPIVRRLLSAAAK